MARVGVTRVEAGVARVGMGSGVGAALVRVGSGGTGGAGRRRGPGGGGGDHDPGGQAEEALAGGGGEEGAEGASIRACSARNRVTAPATVRPAARPGGPGAGGDPTEHGQAGDGRPEQQGQPGVEGQAGGAGRRRRRRGLSRGAAWACGVAVGAGTPTPKANDPAVTWPSSLETTRQPTV